MSDLVRQEFLEAVSRVVGTENLVSEPQELERLSKDPVFNSVAPFVFIYPESNNEIIEILALANRLKVPIWCYSTGKNWGYLNTTNNPHSAVVILSRMNKILHVDEELAYAELEPGVTYEQLNLYLQKNGLKLWPDSPGGPPSGSVVGNALDRGVGVTPYGDHYGHLCGLEVILPNGEVIRTGGYGKNEQGGWHLYKWGIGPIWDGMFTQSNLGIVVKAGIWLMPKPADHCVVSLKIENERGFVRTLDQVRDLMLQGTIPPIARFSNDLAILTLVTQAIKEQTITPGQKCLTPGDLLNLKDKYRVPNWTGSFGLYGAKNLVQTKKKEVKKQLQDSSRVAMYGRGKSAFLRRHIPKLEKIKSERFRKVLDKMARLIFDVSLDLLKLFPSLADLHEGSPVETVVRRGYFRAKTERPRSDIDVARDDIGVLWVVPILPFRGQEILDYEGQANEDFRKFEFDFYMTIMVMSARAVCPLMAILYDRKDPQDCVRAQGLYDLLQENALQKGYQQFRSGLPGWSKIFSNCPEYDRLNQALKQCLDPNNILAPGRYGLGK